MSVRIRPAVLEDTPALFEISRRAHISPAYKSIIPVNEWPRFVRRFRASPLNRTRFDLRMRRYINARHTWVFVAEVDEKPVGYSVLTSGRYSYEFEGLFVDPSVQGRGIGRQLFTAKLAVIKDNKPAHLLVLKDNTPAISLYEKYGFQTRRQSRKRFYGAMRVHMMRNN